MSFWSRAGKDQTARAPLSPSPPGNAVPPVAKLTGAKSQDKNHRQATSPGCGFAMQTARVFRLGQRWPIPAHPGL